MKRVGFTEVEVVERHPFGLDQAARYPLFGPDLIELMRELVPSERHGELAMSVTVIADSP